MTFSLLSVSGALWHNKLENDFIYYKNVWNLLYMKDKYVNTQLPCSMHYINMLWDNSSCGRTTRIVIAVWIGQLKNCGFNLGKGKGRF
jgi:hypothetical protein